MAHLIVFDVVLIVAVLMAYQGAFTHRLVSQTDEEIVFRKPLPLRAGFVLLGVTFLVAPFLLSLPFRQIFTFPALGILAVVIWLGTALLLFALAGPDDLSVNLKRGRFLARYGSGLWPKTRDGKLEDIAGVELLSNLRHGFVVRARLGAPGQTTLLLGRIGQEDQARRFAETTAEAIGRPLLV